ncbi:MAG: hypothetical protein ACYDEA_09870, partial [Candidatus Dormibacteria bacterium]
MPLLGSLTPQLTPVPISTGVATILVAVLMLAHVQFAAWQQGGYIILAVSDFMGWKRPSQHHDRFAKGLVTMLGASFAIGGSLAIFAVMILFLGLWSHFFVTLERILFWPFFYEAIAFVGEIACLYPLYARWDRLGRVRGLRIGLEILLFVNASV